MRLPSLLPITTTLILLPAVLARQPPPSNATSTSTTTASATTPALQAIFTTNPTLPIPDLGRRWTEMIGSKEYLRELISYDERLACETKEREESKNGTTSIESCITRNMVKVKIAPEPEENKNKKGGMMMLLFMMVVAHVVSKPRS